MIGFFNALKCKEQHSLTILFIKMTSEDKQTDIPERQIKTESEAPSPGAVCQGEGSHHDPHFIGDYETAPNYMKDNHHITHGYRINFNTTKKIIKSLFMVHNESVNIWSHCLPAIFIIVFIVTFYFVVDGETVRRSFNDYQAGLQNGIDNYMHALHNLSLIAEYDKFSKQGAQEIEHLKQKVIQNYADLTHNFQETSKKYQDLFSEEMEGVKTSIKDIFKHNTAQFERAKREFELTLAPLLIHQIDEKLNSTWFNELKQQVKLLKKSIDSDVFQMIELHEHRQSIQEISRWPIVLFLITAVICLLCSTIFHLFYPMSSTMYTITNRFDYAGVNLLISGSAFPPLYYGMYCQFEVAIIYLIITLCIASACFVICLFEWIHRAGHQKYKGMLYAGFGCSLLVPLSHMLINQTFYENYGDPFEFSGSMPYYLLLGASYLGGLYIYVDRCPQRRYPGRYNMCGHSHQIWHGFVVMGIFWTYLGALQNFQMRKNSVCPI